MSSSDPTTQPARPLPGTGQAWCYNVMTVDTVAGGGLRLLTVVDEHTGEPMLIHVDTSIDEGDAIRELEYLARQHGMPACASTFNAPPFMMRAVSGWLQRGGSGHVVPSETFATSASGALHRQLRRALLQARVMELGDARAVAREFVVAQPRVGLREVPIVPIVPPARETPEMPAAPTPTPTPAASAETSRATTASTAVPAAAPAATKPTMSRRQRRRMMVARAVTGTIVGLSVLAVIVFGLGPLTGRYRTSPVLGNSMLPMFAKGDLVVLLPKPSKDIKVGDVIQYMPTKGERALVTHRVYRIIKHSDHPTVITRGDNNSYEDPYPVKLQDDYAWRVRWHVPYVGWGLHAFQTTTGLIVLGAAMALLLLTNVVSFLLEMRRNRRAQAATTT